MKTTEIKCDTCARDLTYTGNCEGWRLALLPEAQAHRGGFVTAMAVCPPVDRGYHFCGLGCLDKWRDRERHKYKLRSAFWDAWKEAHGTKDATGRITSYPSPPDEGRAERESEYEAAALAAYP